MERLRYQSMHDQITARQQPFPPQDAIDAAKEGGVLAPDGRHGPIGK